MKRWVFKILAAASLILLLVVAALWARSYRPEELVWADPRPPLAFPCTRAPWSEGRPAQRASAAWSVWAAVGDHGTLWLVQGRYVTYESGEGGPYFLPEEAGWHWRQPSPLLDEIRGSAGFMTARCGLSSFDAQGQAFQSGWPGLVYFQRVVGVGFPFWWLLLVGAVPLAMWGIITRRRRRQGRRALLGLCLTCGYDLRASSERCPECGTPVPADLVRRPMT